MVEYKLITGGVIFYPEGIARGGTEIEENAERWQDYLNWVGEGNTPLPADPPPVPPTNDEIYDQVIQNQKVFKGYVLAVNDGSIVPGSNMTNAQLKAAVKAKM